MKIFLAIGVISMILYGIVDWHMDHDPKMVAAREQLIQQGILER